MVYLLHRFFGRDGREEAEELLTRRSGHHDHPRILTAFNAPIRDWLDFFCFAMFTDRDGKYQLESLSESGFDPLSRTTRFMLTEEAHHMFVGETGVQRVVQRTADLMKQSGRADIHALGGIELAVIQKYLNLWYSESLDLFGAEDSSNAATYFATGIKGRYREHSANVYREHRALEGEYELRLPGGAVEWIPMRRAMNAVLRDAFVQDCERGLARWNRELAARGLEQRLALPHAGFNRKVGAYAGQCCDPRGEVLAAEQFAARRGEWLPTEEDRARNAELMQPVYEPGKIAGWIAPPAKGINGQPPDFEYVILS
jgi:benzoyl-CoA 2,3-dioxygenase component B